MNGVNKISTKNMPREEWLKLRRMRIGGSDASTIVGLNPYQSLYSLWADKLGLMPEKEDTEPMRLGRDLEDYVAKRFTEETGKKVRRENAIILNDRYPFAHANIDRMVIGERAGLECKTTSILNLKKFKDKEFPEIYYAQCVHYLMVTGLDRWYLAVLILGHGFKWFVLERDDLEIAALAKIETDFFVNHIAPKIPPPVDGHESTSSTINAIYSENTDSEDVDLSEFEIMLDTRDDIMAQIKALQDRKDCIDNQIKERMKTATRGESSTHMVVYSSSERSLFDVKRFSSAHKNIDLSQFYKKTVTRTFRVSRKE